MIQRNVSHNISSKNKQKNRYKSHTNKENDINLINQNNKNFD